MTSDTMKYMRIGFMLVATFVSLHAHAQLPCGTMYHVTDPQIMQPEYLQITGCSGSRVNYPDLFGPEPNAWTGHSSCLPEGKTWRFHMKHGASANCQDALYDPTHKGMLEFIGPYDQTMICVGSCGLKANINYDYGAQWSDNGNSVGVTVADGGYSAFGTGHLVEIFNIQTPSGGNRRMLLSYQNVNGVKRLEGFYGYWSWGHFYVEGKVVVFQEGCTIPNACNYSADALWGDSNACDMTSCDCSEPEACNYNNANGTAGFPCDYTSCDCNDVNACNYNEVYFGSGNVDASDQGYYNLCEYSSCDCADPLACNFANENGQSGSTCNYTDCDCDIPGAWNYQAGALIDTIDTEDEVLKIGECLWQCTDENACNTWDLADNPNPCVINSGGCGEDCVLKAGGFSLTTTQSPADQDSLVIALDHTIPVGEAGAFDYGSFHFQARVTGGDWEDIAWNGVLQGQFGAGQNASFTGGMDFMGRLARCQVQLEFRETNNEKCKGVILDDVPSVVLSEAGCNDPAACNFQSLCADGTGCEYAEEQWQSQNGVYTNYITQSCDGVSDAQSCSTVNSEYSHPSFSLDVSASIGRTTNTLIVNSPLECDFQSAQLIAPTQFQEAILPAYVPQNGELLSWVDVGYKRDTSEDLWAARSLNSFTLGPDRYANPEQAIQLSSMEGLGGLFSQSEKASLTNFDGNEEWTMSFWTQLSSLSEMQIDHEIVLYEEMIGRLTSGATEESECAVSNEVPGIVQGCCENEIQLDAGSVDPATGDQILSYSWDVGSNAQAIAVTEAGTYTVSTINSQPVEMASMRFDGYPDPKDYLYRGAGAQTLNGWHDFGGSFRNETIAFWIRPEQPESYSYNMQILTVQEEGSTYYGSPFSIYWHGANERIAIYCKECPDDYVSLNSAHCPRHEWTHVALAFSGLESASAQKLRVYINGIYQGEEQAEIRTNATEDSGILAVGTGWGFTTDDQPVGIFHGYLDHLFWSKQDLTQARIQELIACPDAPLDWNFTLPWHPNEPWTYDTMVFGDWRFDIVNGSNDLSQPNTNYTPDNSGNENTLGRGFFDDYYATPTLDHNIVPPSQACEVAGSQSFEVSFSSPDIIGVCGGSCTEDLNGNGICDDVEATLRISLVKEDENHVKLRIENDISAHQSDPLPINDLHNVWGHFGIASSPNDGQPTFVFNGESIDMESSVQSVGSFDPYSFDGLIDDVGFWSKALSIADLQLLHAANAPALLKATIPFGDATMVSAQSSTYHVGISRDSLPGDDINGNAIFSNETVPDGFEVDVAGETVTGFVIHTPELLEPSGVYAADVTLAYPDIIDEWRLLELWDVVEDSYSIGMPVARKAFAKTESITDAVLKHMTTSGSNEAETQQITFDASTLFKNANATRWHVPFDNVMISVDVSEGAGFAEEPDVRLMYAQSNDFSGELSALQSPEASVGAYIAVDMSETIDVSSVFNSDHQHSLQLTSLRSVTQSRTLDTPIDTLEYSDKTFHPSHKLGEFSPSVVLEETEDLDSQPFVSPLDLGFSESSLPGMMFGNGDGQSTIQLLGSGDLATAKVRISMPMTPNGTGSGVINGAEAYAAELPFWGIPNGVTAFAAMSVVVSSEANSGSQEFDYLSSDSLSVPLLRNAPYLLGDSLICEIQMSELPADFVVPGHALTFDVVGLWSTPGRSCLVTDHGVPVEGETYHTNEVIFCGDPGNVLLSKASQATDEDGDHHIELFWNQPDGGRLTLQRKLPGDLSWTDVITFSDIETTHFVDVLSSNLVGSCDEVEYRLKIFICEELGETYSNSVIETIAGQTEDPWASVVGDEHVVVSKGKSPFNVDVNWTSYNSANDSAKEPVDIFELQRRIYAPDGSVQGSNWEVIATLPTSTFNYQDVDMLAGYLYEYRVSANVLCTGDGSDAIRYQSKPGQGFRHGVAEVSGDITFQFGTAVDSVLVTAENTTDVTDYHLETEQAEFLQLELANLDQDLDSGFVQSFWWKAVNVGVSGTNNGNAVTQSTHHPLASFWYRGLGDSELSELFSVQVLVKGSHSTLGIYKSGDLMDTLSIDSMNVNDWNHTTLQIDLTKSNPTNSNGKLIFDWWDGNAGTSTKTISFHASQNMNENASRLEQVVFGAASEIVQGCIDEHAFNFDAMANSAGHCEFNDQESCTDHNASNYIGNPQPNTTHVQTLLSDCTFDKPSTEVTRIMWYFDENKAHYPTIYRSSDSTLVWSGTSDKIVTGVADDNEIATYRVALTPDDYYVIPASTAAVDFEYQGVCAVVSESQGEILPFVSWSGNPWSFSVAATCLGEIAESATAGDQAFDLAGIEALDYLNVNCSECYSWQFLPSDTLQLLDSLDLDPNGDGLTVSTMPIESFSWGQFGLEFWVRIDRAIDEDITICSLGEASNLVLGIMEKEFSVTNANGETIKAKHITLDQEEHGVSEIQPWLWYHVALSFSGSELRLNVKPMFTDDFDGDPWNDGLEVTLTGSNLSNWMPSGSGRLVTFGSGTFEGLIHRFSLFDKGLTILEANDLFQAGTNPSWAIPESLREETAFVGVAGRSLNYNRMLPLGPGARPMNVLQSPDSIMTILRAPANHCEEGCIRQYNDGIGGIYPPANFNPFVSTFGDCDLSGLAISGSHAAVSTTQLGLDHVQMWAYRSDSLGQPDHLALTYRDRHVPSLADGLLNYLDFDQRVGIEIYDRSRTNAGDWRMNHAKLRLLESNSVVWQTQSADAEVSTPHFVSSGGVTHLKHYAYTDGTTGQYVIPTLKLRGSGSQFKIEPSKTAHVFQPNQLYPNIPDGNRIKENQDFFDLSSFHQDIRVVYTPIAPGPFNENENGVGLGSVYDHSSAFQQDVDGVSDQACPVAGATILIDGLPIFPVATEDDPQPEAIKTDKNGEAKIRVPIGEHTISVAKDGHTFDVSAIQVAMVADAADTLTFFDNTSRRAVGTVLGGAESAKPYGTASNNVGFAKFALFPVTANEDFAQDPTSFVTRNGVTLYPMETCPVIPVQTDEHGAYSTQLLPMQYVIEEVNDSDVEGYTLLESVKTYMEDGDELTDARKIELLNESEHRPTGDWFEEEVDAFILNMDGPHSASYMTADADEIPEGADDFESIVYRAGETLLSWDAGQSTSSGDSLTPQCPTVSQVPTSLDEVLEKQFIGDWNFVKTVGARKYQFDARAHFDEWAEGLQEKPFPAGKPVIEVSLTPRCMAHAVMAVYGCDYEGYSFNELALAAPSESNPLEIVVIEAMHKDQVGTSGTHAFPWQGTPITRFVVGSPNHTNNSEPFVGTLKVELHNANNEDVGSWKPYRADVSDAHSNDDLSETHLEFYILGEEYDELEGSTVPTTSRLDMILRDPPGDGSSSTLLAGSTKMTSREQTSTWGGAAIAGGGVSLGMKTEIGVSIGAFLGLGGGTTTGVETTVETEITNETVSEVVAGSASGVSNGLTESLTITQSISTSAAEQDQSGGDHQDLYFGVSENISRKEIKNFGWELPSPLDNSKTFGGHDLLGSAVPFVCVDCDQIIEAPDGALLPADASAPDTLNFNVAWSTNQRTAIEPASYFLKTEHTIESIDIPQLEALRDAELQAGLNSDPPLYALEDWQHKDSVPDGMYLANGDDPRWILFHQGHWLGKTINGQLWNSTDKFTLPLRPLVYSAWESSGPGYTFHGDNLEDDKVRYYNDLIMQWKLFIAQNELEKLNARELLYDNLANYSDLNDITNPYSPVYGPNLDNGTIPMDASLADIAEWGNLDFAPFFITFSGGGSEYTQSYTKSTVQSQSSNRETSIETNTTNTTGILVNGNGGSITAGASTSSSSGYDFGSESETMLDYSYTLTDDDEDDWQFVAVMPGRGANSAIFLTLNSNGSSCPWLDKETPRYAELFPLLYSPQNLERVVEQTILQETTILCAEKSWQALSVPQDAMAPGNGAITSYFATLHELDNYRSNLVSNNIFTQAQADAFNVVEVTPENEEPKAWSMMESLCTKVENDAPLVIQPAQYQLQQVHLDVVGSEVSFGANINDPIVFSLMVENKSEFGNAADYILNVIPDQNTLGANVSFAGGASSVELSSLVKGSPVEIPVVVEANGLTDFESLVGQIGFYVESLCDSQIYEEIFLNFAFAPDCSPIELDTPVDGWLANTTQVVSASNYADADLMTVQVSGINMKLNNFEGGNQNVFDIQVRRTGATEPSNIGWKTVRTVTKTDTYTNDSGILTVNGNDEGSYFGVISRQELFFDPYGSTVPFEDDAVEIRAVSTCVNGLRRESNVAAGAVDLVRPATFGKPIPQDGIYDLDEQFVVRFNEAMNPSSVQSDAFSVRGFFNGHNNWEGALGFDTFQNVEVLDAPNLLSRSWRASVQVHPKESQEGVHIPLNGVLFSQVTGGDGIEIGFNQNGLRIEIFNSASGTNDVYDFQGFESTDWNLPTWKTFEMEFVFEGYNDNSQLEGYFNVSVNNATSYATPRMPLPQSVSEVLLVGNDASGSSNLTAAVKDIRFWHIPSESDISAWTSEGISNAPLTHPVNGTESGLAMWLTPARQSEGIEVGDWARHRVVSSSAQLILPEGGYSLVPNPTDAWEAVYQNDVSGPESVEFWMKLSALEASVVMSSDTWGISLDDAGLLTLEMQEDFAESSATSATAIDVGTWHHIAVVGEEHHIVKMYVDGMEVLSHQFEEAFSVPGLSFGGADSMNGHVDEVRVWSKSLTQEEIESNMYVRVETSTHSDLVFVEHFEESSPSDGTAVPTGVLSDGTVDPSWDASTYAYIGLDNVSETAVEVVQNVEYNALNDEFLLTFAESELYKFEDQVVTVEMDKTPSDELGNELASSLSWSYFFDRSPLKLSAHEWSTSFTLGESATMTAQLFNESIDVTSFEIVDVPTWLDVHPMQGAIGPLGTVDIEIATTLDVDLGMHVADIRCIDPNFCQPPSNGEPAWCFGENLLVELDVVAEEMEFEFDDSPFSENMAIVARVMNGGFFSHDPEDVVLAYINGELRGVAKLDVGIDGQQFAFLTVHFDAPLDSTTPIDFRVWDASRGITFTSVETSHQGSDTTVFANSAGEQNYSVFEPLVLRTSNRVVQTIDFEDGWNWISFNVEDDRLQNGPATVFSELNGKIEEVRNQTGVAQWNGDSLYNFGLETRLNDMYQVKLNESASLELSGLIPDRIEDAQSLESGWQHLGYNAQRKLPINEALQHLADHAIVMDGDVVKSRSHGFAVYVGDEWVGSLTHMEPDQGYKLFLGQEGDSLGVLVFPADAMIPGFDIRHEPATPDVWEQDVSELMATSTAIVRIETTRPVHRSPHDVLGAFAEIDGEWTCVGQAFALSQDGDALYFLTTYTEGAMTDLTFKWYSDEEGQSFESDDHALFVADEMKGTLTDPFVLRFETPHVDLDQSSEAGRGGVADGSGPCNAKGKLQVSPSLVDNELEANVFVECAILSIDVVDVTGNKVTSLPLSDMGEVSCQGTPGQTLTCDVQHLASGMYRLVVRTEEGILVTPFVKAQ